MSSEASVRVVIVDDSAFMRHALRRMLERDPRIEIVGTAKDGEEGVELALTLAPDVVTMDVEMRGIGGLEALRRIVARGAESPSVIMVSALTTLGAQTTLEALHIGAVDFVAKPTQDVANAMADLAGELQAKVKAAAHTRITPRRVPATASRRVRQVRCNDRIVAIGASTGGVEALKLVLMGLPAECPPILITQHMPPRFTTAFAERLNRECPMTVSEAMHGELVEPNHVYIAPGSHHLELVHTGGHYRCSLSDGPTVSGHRPSVDVLFRSVARVAKKIAIAAILTGMGKDGAEGLLELRAAGAITLGQDEASSLIYGMPRAAFERGAVMRQYSLSHMADAIIDACDAESKAQDTNLGRMIRAASSNTNVGG